jgi:hypothetical protein
MYEFTVNDNAEDFPKVTVDPYTLVGIGVTFVISTWFQILGKMPELKIIFK